MVGHERENDGFDVSSDLPAEEKLILSMDGFEGPIDLLLTLARDQKVDLTRLSILELADQYLAFITQARWLRLELAADYLVMAAWLAYLKSRLLLPAPPGDEEPSGEELAAALTFQLQRLEAMQEAGARLMARPLLGRDFHARGAPEAVELSTRTVFDITFYDLLKAYGDIKRRELGHRPLEIEPVQLYSMDEAIKRLSGLLGKVPDWQTLERFLPAGMRSGLMRRSALAATFAASLELAREGKLELRQTRPYGPIHVRRASPPAS